MQYVMKIKRKLFAQIIYKPGNNLEHTVYDVVFVNVSEGSLVSSPLFPTSSGLSVFKWMLWTIKSVINAAKMSFVQVKCRA